jgi:hypothetical protein
MTKEQESERLARLTELAGELLNEVQSLTEGSGEQLAALSRREKANRRMIQVIIVGIVAIVGLVAALTVALVQVDSNADRIADLTLRLDTSQSLYRRQALCPLYQVFLDYQTPDSRKRAPDPEQYDRAVSLIKQGYKVLKCEKFNEEADGFKNGT